MEEKQTIWNQSVAGVVIRNGCVLLARHTYGAGKGMLIVPGGFVESGETPQEAVRRELLEETGILVEPKEVVGIRFNAHDWYVAFAAEYISGEPRSDHMENSEVLWVPVEDALRMADVPDLSKKIVRSALSRGCGLRAASYENANLKHGKSSFYGALSET